MAALRGQELQSPITDKDCSLGQKTASKLQEHFKAETITKTLHTAQGWGTSVAKPNPPNILLGG